jgi:hypothetical protein
VITMIDRELFILGKLAAKAALTNGNVEQVTRLSELAHQSYFGGSGSFNTSTEAFIQLLNQLWGAVPGNLVHYQKLLLYSSAQQTILDYRDEARSYEALKRTSDRVKHGEPAGTYSPEMLAYAESQLSKQAKKLLAM